MLNVFSLFHILTQSSFLQDIFSGSTHLSDSSTLILERVDRHHAGVYQCAADNGVREPVSMDINLTILCEFCSMTDDKFLLSCLEFRSIVFFPSLPLSISISLTPASFHKMLFFFSHCVFMLPFVCTFFLCYSVKFCQCPFYHL